MKARVAMAVVALVSAGACGGEVGDARAQWVLHVRTDAPVPQLGDRLLVELLGEDGQPACPGCRRLFGLPSASTWPLSFGVPDLGGRPLRLRLRLFRADHSDVGGMPVEGLPIDLVAALPPTRGELVHVHATLSAACAGVAADPVGGLTCDPASASLVSVVLPVGTGEGGPTPGSFALAAKTPCRAAPAADMTCIEGGLYVRGEVRVTTVFGGSMRAVPERLVRISPFAIDRTEMTVRAMRALVSAGAVAAPTSRETDPACTYTATAGAYEDYPVNCVTRERAAEACRARGLRLPTESEWEFAAGSRDEERLYPWGADPDACGFTVIGRGRTGELEGGYDDSTVCRTFANEMLSPFGPRPVGESLDVTAQGVHDLGGNVAEWVLDAPQAYDGPCNAGPRILTDPQCVEPSATLRAVARGGDWSALPSNAAVGHRQAVLASPGTIQVGFRCVVSL